MWKRPQMELDCSTRRSRRNAGGPAPSTTCWWALNSPKTGIGLTKAAGTTSRASSTTKSTTAPAYSPSSGLISSNKRCSVWMEALPSFSLSSAENDKATTSKTTKTGEGISMCWGWRGSKGAIWQTGTTSNLGDRNSPSSDTPINLPNWGRI